MFLWVPCLGKLHLGMLDHHRGVSTMATIIDKHWALKWPFLLHLWQTTSRAGNFSPAACFLLPHRVQVSLWFCCLPLKGGLMFWLAASLSRGGLWVDLRLNGPYGFLLVALEGVLWHAALHCWMGILALSNVSLASIYSLSNSALLQIPTISLSQSILSCSSAL